MSESQIPDEAVQAYVLGCANAPADVRHPERVRAGLAAAYPILATESQAEIERLRARIHEAVDECQRRHAKYVSRCADFDTWAAWALRRFEEAGDPVNGYNYWHMTSEANRLVIMSIIAERDAARLVEYQRLRSHLGAVHFAYRGVPEYDTCAGCNQASSSWVPWPCPTWQLIESLNPAAEAESRAGRQL